MDYLRIQLQLGGVQGVENALPELYDICEGFVCQSGSAGWVASYTLLNVKQGMACSSEDSIIVETRSARRAGAGAKPAQNECSKKIIILLQLLQPA